MQKRVFGIRKRNTLMIDRDLLLEQDSANKIAVAKSEGNVSVNCKTYTDYIFFSKINYLLFPLTFFFFLFA